MFETISDIKKKEDNFLFNSSSQTKLIKKNNTVYDINQNIEEIYVILEGKAESYSNNVASVLTLGKGSVLGLMDTLLDRNYSKKIKAKTTLVLAIINKEKIANALNKNTFQSALIKSLAIDIDSNKPNTWS